MFQNDTPFFTEEQSKAQQPQGKTVWDFTQILGDPLHNPEFAKICGGEGFNLEIYFMTTCSMMRTLAGTDSLPLSVRKLTESCGFIFPVMTYKGKLHIEFPHYSFNVSAEAFGIIFTLYSFWSTRHIFKASTVVFDKELLDHIKTHKEYDEIIGALSFFVSCLIKQKVEPFFSISQKASGEAGGMALLFEKKAHEEPSGEKSVRQPSQDFEIE